MYTYWLLGKARIKLKRPGNARFELQIVGVLIGKRISSMVMVFSLKSKLAPISCKVNLPMIRSYNGRGPPLGYSTMSKRRCVEFHLSWTPI
jgi:hypothetical protein